MIQKLKTQGSKTYLILNLDKNYWSKKDFTPIPKFEKGKNND
jgi:predicted transcriptional regulator